MTRTRTVASALGALVLALTACGQQTAHSSGGSSGHSAGRTSGDAAGPRTTGTSAGGAEPGSKDSLAVHLDTGEPHPRLTCPTDERSTMIADFAHLAGGAPTPEDAVGDGLVQSGEQLVISARGTTAWVVRPDGTARVEIGLVHHEGWLLHERTTCG